MGYAPRALLAAGLGFAVSCLVACGGGAHLLSGEQSANLNGHLDAVSSAIEAGHCGGAGRALVSFTRSVSSLPATVSPTLRANLLQGASTVAQLARQDCRTTSTTTPSSTTTTAPTTTSTTTTTTTPSTSSTTTTSTSTSTTTPSTTSTTPATSTTTPGTTTTTPGTGGAGIGGGTTTTGSVSAGGGSSGGGATGQ